MEKNIYGIAYQAQARHWKMEMDEIKTKLDYVVNQLKTSPELFPDGISIDFLSDLTLNYYMEDGQVRCIAYNAKKKEYKCLSIEESKKVAIELYLMSGGLERLRAAVLITGGEITYQVSKGVVLTVKQTEDGRFETEYRYQKEATNG